MSSDDKSMTGLVSEDTEPPEAGEDPLIGSVIADRYRIEEKLGEGGMGAVYRAEHVLMQKPVAIKVLHREMTLMDEAVKRFEREAIAAGRIEHPNVAAATDFGKLPDGAFFLVLEFIPGRSLSQVLSDDGAIEAERALLIARQVAAALGAAHHAGIVHRDLKPDNVMLVNKGGTSEFVKVLDFGIAKVQTDTAGGQQLTRLGSVFGTPQYMAPEQAAGKPVDGRADLYALGLILYEMLSGEPAFQHEDLIVLLTRQMTAPPEPLPGSVDPALCDLVMKLLAKNAEDRFRSAEDLIDSIDVLLGPLAPMPESGILAQPHSRTHFEGPDKSLGEVPFVAAVSQLADHARTAQERIGEVLAHPVVRGVPGKLKQSVRLAGRDVPLWGLGLAGTLLVASVVVAVGAGGARDTAESSPGRQTNSKSEPKEAQLDKTLALAEVGQRDAMNELAAYPVDDRSAAIWAALARGHATQKETSEALRAYEHALKLDATLAEDKRLTGLVRRAVNGPLQQQALRLAAASMGAQGADLLFDVWASTSEQTQTTRAAKEWLDSKAVRANASRALRIALDLRAATSCGAFKALLPDAKLHADERSVRPLQALTSRKGCGFLGMGDCYRCLRGGSQLSDAIEGAALRRAPRLY